MRKISAGVIVVALVCIVFAPSVFAESISVANGHYVGLTGMEALARGLYALERALRWRALL